VCGTSRCPQTALFVGADPHTFDMVQLAQDPPLQERPLAGGLALLAIGIGLAVKSSGRACRTRKGRTSSQGASRPPPSASSGPVARRRQQSSGSARHRRAADRRGFEDDVAMLCAGAAGRRRRDGQDRGHGFTRPQ
jgi:hypothetical protein